MRYSVDDLKIGIYHGTSTEIKKRLIESGRYNIIVCGHTHKREPPGVEKGNISQRHFDTCTKSRGWTQKN